MLMAIEAVRSGKMGFTQAGKAFSVNGRTLWVYYRKLGYEVHNTFRGRRQKGSINTTIEAPTDMQNINCAGSSHQQIISDTLVPEQEDMSLAATNDQIAGAPLSESVPPMEQSCIYGSHQPTSEIPNDDMQADDASRALQSLLESYNLRNIWTNPT